MTKVKVTHPQNYFDINVQEASDTGVMLIEEADSISESFSKGREIKIRFARQRENLDIDRKRNESFNNGKMTLKFEKYYEKEMDKIDKTLEKDNIRNVIINQPIVFELKRHINKEIIRSYLVFENFEVFDTFYEKFRKVRQYHLSINPTRRIMDSIREKAIEIKKELKGIKVKND